MQKNSKITISAILCSLLFLGGFLFFPKQLVMAEQNYVGKLIKIESNESVFYLGTDNKRHSIPSLSGYEDYKNAVMDSWSFSNSDIIIISSSELFSYELGENMTIKPNTYKLKLETDAKVYNVAYDNVLRQVDSTVHHSSDWNDFIIIPVGFFMNYVIDNDKPIVTSRAINITDSSIDFVVEANEPIRVLTGSLYNYANSYFGAFSDTPSFENLITDYNEYSNSKVIHITNLKQGVEYCLTNLEITDRAGNLIDHYITSRYKTAYSVPDLKITSISDPSINNNNSINKTHAVSVYFTNVYPESSFKQFRIKMHDKISGYTEYKTVEIYLQKIITFFLDAGDYDLDFIIDSDNSIIESDESNNVTSKKFTVSNLGKPDLVIQNIQFSPADLVLNQTYKGNLNVNIKNQGTVATNYYEGIRVSFTLKKPDGTLIDAGIKPIDYLQYKQNLGSGEEMNVSFGINNMIINATSVIATVWVDNAETGLSGFINESDETNNMLIKIISITQNSGISNNYIIGAPIDNIPPLTIINIKELNKQVKYNSQLIKNVKGRMLLRVERGGEIWYVNPKDGKKYSVTFANALPLFGKLSLGINGANLAKIPVAGTNEVGDWALRSRLKGWLLLDVENGGAIWYVDLNGYRHSVTWGNLMSLFTKLSLGITDNDLNKIYYGEL